MLELNKVYCVDCVKGMKQLDDDVVDTVIVDPPYGLSFMNRKWDYDIPSIDVWNECLRVSKPGATLLCFGGTRTWHRIACGLEDAGWNIRDTLMWLYGSGFPKAYDISKGIDKKFGVEREVYKEVPSSWGKSLGPEFNMPNTTHKYSHPVSKEAKEWDGWKSHGLKPAWEPIIMAMKPNNGGYVDNALKWGVSGLNIDDARIGTKRPPTCNDPSKFKKWKELDGCKRANSCIPDTETNKGRFPSNVILDETAVEMLDKQVPENRYDMGELGASRFFYVAKASSEERDNNSHPTLKPLKLMEYLCNLTKTPRGGLVMDCFCGSGTTLIAAKKTGRKWLGFDNCQEYIDVAQKRIDSVVAEPSLEDWGI